MKILVVSQHYAPEPFRLPDIAEELTRRGHEVTVITGVPNYPMGKIYPGYGFGKKKDETVNGVRIHRSFTVARRKGVLFRFINYYSFSISSTLYALSLKKKFDAVFINQTSPVMMVNAGIRYARKHHVKSVLYCMDIWPECLTASGIKKDSLIYRHYRKTSEKLYQGADTVLCTSESHKTYFSDMFGMHDVKYLPQYAESLFTPEDCKKTPDGHTDLMFAGNLGAAQDLKTVVEAARLTENTRIRWHLVGDGIRLEALKKQAEGLSNIFFYGRKPLAEMPAYYRMADAMLVTMQDDPVMNYTLPGKVQTYMAAGKAIIGCIGGEAKKVIEASGAGLCAEAGNAVLLAECAKQFAASKNKEIYAANSLRYSETHFNRDTFINQLIGYLSE